MILYFTGTGNSYDVATRLGVALEDDVVSMNALLKSGSVDKLVSTKPFLFVCPTYASRIPNVVRDFILDHTFEGPKEVYFVITYGGFAGPVGHYVKAFVKQKGWVLQGFDKVRMPENYIVLFPNPNPRTVAHTLTSAYRKLDKVIAEIKSGSHFYHSGHVGYLFTKMENKGFYQYAVTGKAFVVNPELCIKCGTCVKACPMNNISLNDKGPLWGDKCCGCLGCLHNCPKKAINYQKKTVKKGRYVNPNYSVK